MENDKSSSAEEKPPQHKYKGIKAMPFVIGNETFEKLGTIGTSSNLLVYLTTVFNMKSITATTLVNTLNGTTSFSPLLGAFLCDTYLGRYKTIGFASIASFVGMLVLTLTAAVPALHPPHCGTHAECAGPTTSQLAVLLIAFAFLVIGAGGIRPCNLAFGVDQFNPETESGKRGISSFFNWYFFTLTFAMMVALTLIVYVQSNVSWTLGLAIPTALMILSCIFFFVGSRIYVKVKPEGSPLRGVARVVMAAIKKRHLKPPEQPWMSLYNHVPSNSINSRLAHTKQFRCLDKAAIQTPTDELKPDGSPVNPLTLCSLQNVEEVKCLIRVVPIWATGIIYYMAIVEQQTYVVFQALQSDRRLAGGIATAFRIPAASYIAFAMLALTIWIPIYDRLIVPFLRRLTGKEAGITLLQKIGAGFCLVVVEMFVAGAVERRRRDFALTKPLIGIEERRGGISSLSGLWLLPQLAFSGMAEAFASVGMTEFYYKQFPENMRSIASAFLLAGFAVSNYLSGLLVTVVHRTTAAGEGNWVAEDLNRGRLDLFYFMVGGIELVNLALFLVCARRYRYKGDCSAGEAVATEELQSKKGVV